MEYAAAAVGEQSSRLSREFKDAFIAAARTGQVLDGASQTSAFGPQVKVGALCSGALPPV